MKRCLLLQGGLVSYHSCAHFEFLIFRDVSPGSGNELSEWNRRHSAPRDEPQWLVPEPKVLES